MNRLTTDARSRVLACLCEGVSQRATCRLTGAARATFHNSMSDILEGSPVMRIPHCPSAGKFGTVRLIYGLLTEVHFHEDAMGGSMDRTLSGIPLSALEVVPQDDQPFRME